MGGNIALDRIAHVRAWAIVAVFSGTWLLIVALLGCPIDAAPFAFVRARRSGRRSMARVRVLRRWLRSHHSDLWQASAGEDGRDPSRTLRAGDRVSGVGRKPPVRFRARGVESWHTTGRALRQLPPI